MKVTRNARLTSSFCTLVTTIVPNVTTPKKMTALLPHWPGLSHASFVRSIIATIPKAEGLKMCFWLKRRTYFEATVKKAASKLTYQSFVFNKRHRLIALIRTLKPHRSNSVGFKNLFAFIESAAY